MARRRNPWVCSILQISQTHRGGEIHAVLTPTTFPGEGEHTLVVNRMGNKIILAAAKSMR